MQISQTYLEFSPGKMKNIWSLLVFCNFGLDNISRTKMKWIEYIGLIWSKLLLVYFLISENNRGSQVSTPDHSITSGLGSSFNSDKESAPRFVFREPPPFVWLINSTKKKCDYWDGNRVSWEVYTIYYTNFLIYEDKEIIMLLIEKKLIQ